MRGYVGDDHKLTKWGEALEVVLNKLVPKFESVHSAEDAALLAVELLRLGLLNGNEVDGTVIAPTGKPTRLREECRKANSESRQRLPAQNQPQPSIQTCLSRQIQ
jgi:hypothetical protein